MIEELSGKPLSDEFVEANRAWIEDCMERGVYWAWFAEDASGIIGVAAVRERAASPRETDPLGREAYVQNVYVESRARGRGIARALMEHLLAWCDAAGYNRIALRASDDGRGLYEKLRFVADTQMILAPPR